MSKLLQSGKLILRLYDRAQHDLSPRSIKFNNIRAVFPIRFFTSSTADEAEIDVESITQGDADLEHKLKVLTLETEVMRQEGLDIPSSSFLKTHHWQELLNLGSRSGRRKFLQFLFKTEKKKENDAVKKEQKRSYRESRPKEEIISDHIQYDLSHNNIFLRFYDTTMNNLYNSKLIEAMQFGQKLVVDCGYDRNMTSRENLNCSKQLMLLFADNRFHEDPFDLHFCNCDKESMLLTSLHRRIATMYEPSFPLNIHEKSYLELFPKEQLIYLTPHCKEEMKTYDHDAIHIIGGIVDKVNNEPLSLAKAKEEGLRMLKLPLDRHLQWGSGSGKSLTLNQVCSILLDVKRTGDWKFALRHVPKRKLTDFNALANSDKSFSGNPSFKQFKTEKFNLRYNPKSRNNSEGGNNTRRNIRSIFNE